MRKNIRWSFYNFVRWSILFHNSWLEPFLGCKIWKFCYYYISIGFPAALRDPFRPKRFHSLGKLVEIIGIGIQHNVTNTIYTFSRWFIPMHVIKTFILRRWTESDLTVQTVSLFYLPSSSRFPMRWALWNENGCFDASLLMTKNRWTMNNDETNMKQYITKMKMASRRPKFVGSVRFRFSDI